MRRRRGRLSIPGVRTRVQSNPPRFCSVDWPRPPPVSRPSLSRLAARSCSTRASSTRSSIQRGDGAHGRPRLQRSLARPLLSTAGHFRTEPQRSLTQPMHDEEELTDALARCACACVCVCLHGFPGESPGRRDSPWSWQQSSRHPIGCDITPPSAPSLSAVSAHVGRCNASDCSACAQVRARWLRETSTQIRLEQQMLTLKTSAESIVRSWAVQFYGARGTAGLPTTPRRRKNPDDAGLPRRGF